MIGYIYLTTNNINHKVYIGKKESSYYDETYLGSGKILNRAIRKYGKENFSNVILYKAETLEELNQKEKEYISEYKNRYGRNCYNIAGGGTGGNTLMYSSKDVKEAFRNKMTSINRERCKSEEFKNKISRAVQKRYSDPTTLEQHRQKVKKAWSNEELRLKQSNHLKKLYKERGERDCSYNNIRCVFELNDEKIVFDSIKALRSFLKTEKSYTPDQRKFNKLLEDGEKGIPFKPFHKNNDKLNSLTGMIIYRLKEDVETKGDECSPVGVETSTTSKCETTPA